MYCASRRAWKHGIPLFSFVFLPPKSGLNRMSYPFISLSTVSLTSGILLGSLRSFALHGEGRGGKKVVWCKIAPSTSRAVQALYVTCRVRENRDADAYLWAQTKVTSKEKVKIPKWFFLILPIATVFEAVSGCEWGERTSNLLQTAQRSQWGAHACSQPNIKVWGLMMVDEQFPLQRKILKGQVDVRNEETDVFKARSEENSDECSILSLFYCHVADGVVCILTRSNIWTHMCQV